MSQGHAGVRGSHTLLLTVVISVLTTVVIGGILYYTLKRHELAHAQEVGRLVTQASEQRAITVSRVFAALTRRMLQGDLAILQDLVNGWSNGEGPRDVVVVSRDNVVLAAKVSGQVGQKIQDATWLSWKAENREVAQRAVDQQGQSVFVVVEPLKERDDTRAWAMLTFVLPEAASVLRSPEERLTEVARLLVPILVLLFVSVGLAMKLASASIRRQVQSVMTSMLDEPVQQGEGERLRKAN